MVKKKKKIISRSTKVYNLEFQRLFCSTSGSVEPVFQLLTGWKGRFRNQRNTCVLCGVCDTSRIAASLN